MEKTFALIKPDAVAAGNAEEIAQLAEAHGFTVVEKQTIQLTRNRAESFYGEHNGKPFFKGLVDFMTSGPAVAMVLMRENAIKEWRALMGPTNTFVARETNAKCLRALYGTDGTRNATHGSDSPASAEREIKFFFPHLIVDDAPPLKHFEALQPALLEALTALAKSKMGTTTAETLKFVGEYLLAHNPNKPKVMLPGTWKAVNGPNADDLL